mgnify:CR=1 FL=1
MKLILHPMHNHVLVAIDGKPLKGFIQNIRLETSKNWTWSLQWTLCPLWLYSTSKGDQLQVIYGMGRAHGRGQTSILSNLWICYTENKCHISQNISLYGWIIPKLMLAQTNTTEAFPPIFISLFFGQTNFRILIRE